MKPTIEKPVESVEQKKSHWYTSEIFKVFFYPVFIVLLSIGLSHYFWIMQFENTRNQQFLEMKIKAYENYASTARRMIQLSEYYNRVHLEKLKLVEEITYKRLDKSKIKDGDEVWTTINSTEQDSTLAVALKKEPYYAEYYQKFLDFQNEYQASSSLAILLFNPEVRNELNLFDDMFTYNELKKKMVEQKGTQNFSIKDVDIVLLMNKIMQEKQTELNNILYAMSNEIYGE